MNLTNKKAHSLFVKKLFNLSDFSSFWTPTRALVVYFRSFSFDIMPCGLNLFLEVAFNYKTFQSFTCFHAFALFQYKKFFKL